MSFASATSEKYGVVRRWLPLLLLGVLVGTATSWLVGSDVQEWVATSQVEIRDEETQPGTAVVTLLSPTTWQRVAADENIETDEFIGSLGVEPVGQSNVLSVTFRSVDNAQAVRVVNGLVGSFTARSTPPAIDEELSVIGNYLSTLQARRVALEQELASQQDPAVFSRTQTLLALVNGQINHVELRSNEVQTEFETRTADIPVVLSVASLAKHSDSPNKGLDAIWGGLVGFLSAGLVGYVVYSPELVRTLAAAGAVIDGFAVMYPPVGSTFELVAKRTADIVLGLLGLIVLSPLFLVLAASVKLSSNGPVLFRQERIGFRGQPFLINKFRTMNVANDDSEHRKLVISMLNNEDVEPENGGIYKLDDPRVTRIGAFLRRYSLDELPQLWNVVKGEMSLIGPRPSLPWEHELYSNDLKQRVRSKPGCSGLWQVSGHNKLTVPEMLELDIEYVERWNIALDIEVLLRTPLAVFGRGSTR